MKQLIRYISLVVVCICTFLLSGCSFVWTMENGDPATPEDIKASVEKEFSVVHPRLVLHLLWWRRRNLSSAMCMFFM